ncbi:hypothetical protein D3C83_212770 [compost metagenome]
MPDIIIHVPGPKGPNIAAIEVKGWWNDAGHDRDRAKLRGYVAKQRYAVAYFVQLESDAPKFEKVG